jgi:hypothetical protein
VPAAPLVQADGGDLRLPVGSVSAGAASAVSLDTQSGSSTSRALAIASQPRGRAAAGWYADPAGTDKYRYWNGDAWTIDLR